MLILTVDGCHKWGRITVEQAGCSCSSLKTPSMETWAPELGRRWPELVDCWLGMQIWLGNTWYQPGGWEKVMWGRTLGHFGQCCWSPSGCYWDVPHLSVVKEIVQKWFKKNNSAFVVLTSPSNSPDVYLIQPLLDVQENQSDPWRPQFPKPTLMGLASPHHMFRNILAANCDQTFFLFESSFSLSHSPAVPHPVFPFLPLYGWRQEDNMS